MKSDGSRSRNGCFGCRKRKRRCDERKPTCSSCTKRYSRCIYPAALPLIDTRSFITTVSPSCRKLSTSSQKNDIRFIHLHSFELPSICPDYQDLSYLYSSSQESKLERTQLFSGSLPTVPGELFASGPENLLIQYYAEVVSVSRVFVKTERNLFLTLIMPHVLLTNGPLKSTVLALSAAEWSNTVLADGQRYATLSAFYKGAAIRKLQHCLHDKQLAEENVLTCVLLASLEIASGSSPTWLKHLQGVLAILRSFGKNVDPSVAAFVVQYFRFRYILMQTTRTKAPNPKNASTSVTPASLDAGLVSDLKSFEIMFQPSIRTLDEHIGCSMEMMDIIEEIRCLSLDEDCQRYDKGSIYGSVKLQNLNCKILGISFEHFKEDNYLRQSAECFKIASTIYFNFACINTCLQNETLLELHGELLKTLSKIIYEGQIRRSFPMWPLFIAAVTSTRDEQRKIILNLFSILSNQWPVSNIAAVMDAVRIIWSTQDFKPSPLEFEPQYWQDIVHKYNWKLALS